MANESYNIRIDADIEPLIPKFFKNLRADIDSSRKAAAAENSELIAELGHKSKGASGSYGFHPLQEIFNKIEQSGEKGEFLLILSLLDQATDYIDNVKIEYVSLDECDSQY